MRTGDRSALEEAVRLLQRAVDATPDGHPDRAGWLSGLGIALRTRFERTGVLADLDAAVEAGRAAVDAAPADHPDRAATLLNLGLALHARFERTGVPADLDAAVDAGRAAVGVELAPARIRVRAARVWGRAAAAGGRWESAVAGFAAAAGLLGELAPRELSRSDQEGLLAEVGGVGADAAVYAVRAGDPVRAVELFEQGRGVLLGQVLDTRGDLRPLEQQHPALHARFVALTAELDQPDTAGLPPVPGPAAGSGPDDRDLPARRRRALRAELDGLVAEIRRQPGLGDFLYSPTLAQLTPAAADGPVAVVAISEFGAYALVLTPGGVADPIGLDGLSPQAAADEANAFLAALDTVASPAATPATREAVLAALPGAGRAHFACHGSAELANPSASRLLLHDHRTQPLTVLDVARLRLDGAELAFLSACETARPGTRLFDEAIHLTSAFQLAGYRHVVGTLWPVGDEHAVEFADRVYTEVAATGDVARGVHAATRQLRSHWLHDPSVWASHVHVGA